MLTEALSEAVTFTVALSVPLVGEMDSQLTVSSFFADHGALVVRVTLSSPPLLVKSSKLLSIVKYLPFWTIATVAEASPIRMFTEPLLSPSVEFS